MLIEIDLKFNKQRKYDTLKTNLNIFKHTNYYFDTRIKI